VAEWGPWEAFQRGTVDGSRDLAEACLHAGARRLVHVEFRDFVTRWLATAGVEALDCALPVPVARALAAASEWAWRVLPLPGAPPMARLAPWLLSLERTVDDSRARAELATSP
jgi:hypothetical protein